MFDQSWMGYGMIGGLQAAAIAVVVGFVVLAVVYGWGRRQGWHAGRILSISYLLSVILAGGKDLWNLVYFSMIPSLESVQLMKVKLAEVHDPESIGVRVMFECMGALVGVFVSWWLFNHKLRTRGDRPKKQW